MGSWAIWGAAKVDILARRPSCGLRILVWLGYLELFGFLAIVNMQEGKTVPWRKMISELSSEDRKPGDFGLRGFYPADAKGQYEMQVGDIDART